MDKEELIKLRTFNRILNNIGVNDNEISARIANKVKKIELDTFLLVFPINGMEPISPKKAEEVLGLPSYPQSHGHKNVQKVISTIYSETGIMLTETNIDLIALNSEDYEKYYSDVSSFFLGRGFSKNDIILEIMRNVSVKYFNYFLNIYSKKSITQKQLSEETGISESILRSKFSYIKRVIKEKMDLDVFGEKWRDTTIIVSEEYKQKARDYFIEIGIEDESILKKLTENMDQRDFRVLSSRYPLGNDMVQRREEVINNLGISLEMTKKSLERSYGLFYEEGISFLRAYIKYKRRCLQKHEIFPRRGVSKK